MYNNIPDELKGRQQWLCWRTETTTTGKPTKIPYDPRTGQKASVDNPSSWCDFHTAENAARSVSGYNGIGFVLTENDPYTIIDLDNKEYSPIDADEHARQIQILTAFRETYIERSQSKRGFHIVCKARIPKGVHRGSVEMYSNLRYMAFTGDILPQNIRPIIDCQQLVDSLYEKMTLGVVNPSTGLDESGEEILTDAEVCEMGLNAVNGDKFLALGNGQWRELKFPSQSEADLSFISMLCFYSRNNDQVRRMFRLSKLGQRDKAIRDDVYINRAISRCRANGSKSTEQELAFAKEMAEELKRDHEAKLAEAAKPKAPPIPAPPKEGIINAPYEKVLLPQFPGGLIGEIAEYFMQTAHRPVAELALAAALCFVAGVVGRCFNISNSGLSLYLLYIAPTGTGKEGAARGISNLIAAVKPQIPNIDDFIGPGSFASGQGMLKYLEEQPCFVSTMGEFGLWLSELNHHHVSASVKMIKRIMLDIFGKSGWNDRINPTVYSDTQKKIKTIYAPSMTIFGETTPESFYDKIDQSDIADGFLPRFHIVEYKGARVAQNDSAGCPPSAQLVSAVGDLAAQALAMKSNNANSTIDQTPSANAVLRDFNKECDYNINTATNDAERQLWNRAHLKAIKLAGLVAVGINSRSPCVDEFAAQWAIAYTRRGVELIQLRFFEGDVGQGENKQRVEIIRLIAEWFSLDKKGMRGYKIDTDELQKNGIIPFSYISARADRLAIFTKDRLGQSRSLQNQLNILVESEILSSIDANTAATQFNRKQRLYRLGALWKKSIK